MKAGEGCCTDVTSGGASKLLLLAQGWAQRSNSICYAAAAYGGSKLGSFDHPRNTAQINLSLKLKLEVLPTGTYQNRHRNWHRNFGPETPVHRSFRYYGRNGAESTVISSLASWPLVLTSIGHYNINFQVKVTKIMRRGVEFVVFTHI